MAVLQNGRRALLGRKLGMTQLFSESEELLPVTVLQVGPCRILQVKSPEKDGYSSLKVGFDETGKKTAKPLAGVFAKAGTGTMRYVKEVPMVPQRENKPGDELSVDLFKGIKYVDVTGVSKGRGFAGTIRRHNFSSGPRSHGCKNVREIGASGMSFPSRVAPGRPMPGQMGNRKCRVKNLAVVRLDKERNLLFVRGGIPGPKGGYVYVQESSRGS